MDVGRNLGDLPVELAESLRGLARFLGKIGDAESAVEGGAGKLERRDVDDRGRAHIGDVDAELSKLAREDAEIVLEGEIGAEDIGARLLHGEHDGREILALVGVALVERDGRADLAERLGEGLAAGGAEGVGRVHDGPFLLAERVDAIVGEHAARV